MTFAQLALSNLKGSWLRYAAFFLSSTFSVLLFFMYAQFLFHPDLASGYVYGGETTRVVLSACLFLVALFAFFFVTYSSSSFLRARGQEFGMLTLLGTTRRQLKRLVWVENTLLSLLAIVAGIALGLLFNRLFFLGLARVLQVEDPLSVQLVPMALLHTAGGFFVLFQAVILFSSFSIGRRSVLDLLQDARRPRTAPRARPVVAIMGLLLVLSGYVVALVAEAGMVGAAFLPVTVVVVFGTYLVFSEATVWFLNRTRDSDAYLRGTTMLSVSQLIFRLKDNSRLLATITNLSAVVLAAAGTFYIVTQLFHQQSATAYPTALAIHQNAGIEPAQVLSLADNLNVPVRTHGSVTLKMDQDYLISQSQAEAIMTDPDVSSTPLGEVQRMVGEELLTVQQLEVALTMTPVAAWDWYVLPDNIWRALPAEPFSVDYYDWPDHSTSAAISIALQERLGPDAWFRYTSDRYTEFRSMQQTLALSMFAGLFVSLLFFIGSGSLIYFKLFTELPEDRRIFTRLKRIGVTSAESRRYITAQIAVIFLLPFAAGSVHAVVALDALGGMLLVNVLGYSLLVVLLFAAVQLAFFLLTRWTYLRALVPGRSPG